MQPLYTDEELQLAKSRTKLPLKCEICGKTFHVSKNHILASNSGHHSVRDTCSQKCANVKKSNRIDVSCLECGKTFQKTPCQVTAYGNNFCNRSCSTRWRNLHKKHGTRRSKLETWLEEQLTAIYPNLEIHFNRKDAINSELDIFIPSLQLAFELNGIYHYEPIHGIDKMNSVQSNDHRKMLACAERDIEMCSIDTSHQTYFKEQSSRKFLKIITDIINSRLSDS